MFWLSVTVAAVQLYLAWYLIQNGYSPWPCILIAIAMIFSAWTQAPRKQ